MTTLSAHIAHTLSAHISELFGVMGNGNAYLLDAIERLDGAPLCFTPVRHEAAGVAAADAYYRGCGRLAAATATYGAGFTNTLTALAESCRARIPLVLVTGDMPTGGPRQCDVDQTATAAGIGVRTFTVGRNNAAELTLRAIENAITERTASILAIPYDLADLDVGPVPSAPPRLRGPRPTDRDEQDFAAGLADVAHDIAEAKRPLLLAGRGAWISGAGDSLGRLAAASGAVSATTALARGIFPDHRYDLGVTGGFGQDEAMRLIRHADTVVVFGASLNQFTMRFGELFTPEARVIQVDLAEAPLDNRVNIFIRCDADLAARTLVHHLSAHPTPVPPWRETIDFAPLRRRDSGTGTASDGRLDPRSVAARLGESLPEDRVVVSDGGHFIGWANTHWSVSSPDRMMMVGTAFQTIGLGISSMVGAARAKPESTIVLTTGDGGALMALADLESAVRVAQGRGLAIVWNDAAYGAELNLYGLKGLAETPMRIPETDFSALATAIGAEGVTVREIADLDRLITWTTEPAESRRFLLLDCHISPRVVAPYQKEIARLNGVVSLD